MSPKETLKNRQEIIMCQVLDKIETALDNLLRDEKFFFLSLSRFQIE